MIKLKDLEEYSTKNNIPNSDSVTNSVSNSNGGGKKIGYAHSSKTTDNDSNIDSVKNPYSIDSSSDINNFIYYTAFITITLFEINTLCNKQGNDKFYNWLKANAFAINMMSTVGLKSNIISLMNDAQTKWCNNLLNELYQIYLQLCINDHPVDLITYLSINPDLLNKLLTFKGDNNGQ